MTTPASFAWRSAGLLCGECHFMMHHEISKNDIPVEFRAACPNLACPNFGKIFRVGRESSVALYEITDQVAMEEIKK